MTRLEQAFAVHNAEQVPVPEVRIELFTPCGVRFTTEPMYNTATGLYDSIMYVFETGEQIIVDDELDSFHEAYEQYHDTQFDEIQVPVEKEI
ncbi:UNVERIFIED_ORG: hypothetical protein GCAPEGMB_00040 [Vibrio phage V07]|nr:hypothetical protein COHAPHLL_00179 [Vibrio phage V09]UNA01886.1 hypothetical protein [Vibrio phage PC-Liy1]URQ03183.1 hypothetical protein PVA8_197 [Vibrio phage PVA8]WBM58918.1 hypothetical protein vBValMPVA8_196 [Vibrio phage vB_ValM_PVA8]WOL24903.1 hypothetical protein [Vibrio phage PG216]